MPNKQSPPTSKSLPATYTDNTLHSTTEPYHTTSSYSATVPYQVSLPYWIQQRCWVQSAALISIWWGLVSIAMAGVAYGPVSAALPYTTLGVPLVLLGLASWSRETLEIRSDDAGTFLSLTWQTRGFNCRKTAKSFTLPIYAITKILYQPRNRTAGFLTIETEAGEPLQIYLQRGAQQTAEHISQATLIENSTTWTMTSSHSSEKASLGAYTPKTSE